MVLEGIRVVELATYVAGPGAGGLMADWGADVVKIERPAGDPMRHFFASLGLDTEFNPPFELDNRGKRSIVIDLRHEQGCAIVRRLLENTDVFITNARPAQLRKMRLDYGSVSIPFPKLVYATITGYGLEGPDADRAAMDTAAFWARSGLTALSTPKGQEPAMPRMAMGDHITAMALLSGVLAALVERGRTGKGRLVEASLLRTALYAAGSDVANQLHFGRTASTRPRTEAVNPTANYFQAKDGRWLVLLSKQARDEWATICNALERPDLRDDPRFATVKLRRANVEALIEGLDAAFAQFTLEEIGARLSAKDMVWAPVAALKDALADPQTIASGAIMDLPLANGEVKQTPAGPLRFPGVDEAPKPAPPLGRDTRALLDEAGYSADEIEALIAAGAVKAI